MSGRASSFGRRNLKMRGSAVNKALSIMRSLLPGALALGIAVLMVSTLPGKGLAASGADSVSLGSQPASTCVGCESHPVRALRKSLRSWTNADHAVELQQPGGTAVGLLMSRAHEAGNDSVSKASGSGTNEKAGHDTYEGLMGPAGRQDSGGGDTEGNGGGNGGDGGDGAGGGNGGDGGGDTEGNGGGDGGDGGGGGDGDKKNVTYPGEKVIEIHSPNHSNVTGPLVQLPRDQLKITRLPFSGTKADNIEQYAGHVVLGENSTNTFFIWLVMVNEKKESKTEEGSKKPLDRALGKVLGRASEEAPPPKKKFVMWFNGGPGCSSMTGAMMELGPFVFQYVDRNYRFVDNEANVTGFANVVFVDQPPGTGLSILDGEKPIPKDYDSWIELFVEFLTKLFGMFPEFLEADLYLTGESFAGFYLPHYAKAIFDNSAKITGFKIENFKGIVVGNPWFDPITQYPSYYGFTKDNKVLTGSAHLETIAKLVDSCNNVMGVDAGNYTKTKSEYGGSCDSLLGSITRLSTVEHPLGLCTSYYDIRLPDSTCGMSWPGSVTRMPDYLDEESVILNLHIAMPGASNKSFNECSGVLKALRKAFDEAPAGAVISAELLGKHKDFRIVVFEGDKDLICNVYGMTEAIGRMKIGDAPVGMGKFAKYDWFLKGANNTQAKVGEYYKYNNLEYYVIYGGSHMPAVERPAQFYDVFLRSIQGHDAAAATSSLVVAKDVPPGKTGQVSPPPAPPPTTGGQSSSQSPPVIALEAVSSVCLVGMLVFALTRKGSARDTTSAVATTTLKEEERLISV